MSAPVTRNLTILLTDIKGFTDKTSNKSRSEIQELLDRHRQIVLPILEGKGGNLVKTIGDAFLMSFESPTDAVLAGVAVQEALAAHNKGRAPEDRLDVRIAINSGEVNLAEGDVFGEPVNITSRIEGIAEAGEVFFTEAVYLAMNKKEVPSSEVGLLQLKGIPEKVRVYKVKRERPVGQMGAEPDPVPPYRETIPTPAPKARLAAPAGSSAIPQRPPSWRRALALAFDGLICSVLVGIFFHKSDRVTVRYDSARKAKSVSAAREHGETQLSVGDSGVKITGKDATVSIGEEGVQIRAKSKEGDAEETLFEDGGLSVGKEESQRGWHFPLVWFIYNLVFLKRLGATPGKRILKLSVTAMDGQAPDKKQVLWRCAFSLISGYVLFLGYLWALFEKDRRGWHDLIAGTRVVSAA